MSAYLGFAYPDRVELLTDGASTLHDGRVGRAMTKVWSTPLAPFAVTGAGNLETVESIAMYLRGHAVVQGVDGALDALHVMPRPSDDMSIVIAAVSETEGPGIWVYSTRDDDFGCGAGPIPACTVTKWQGFVAMGSGLGDDGLSSLGLTPSDFVDGIADGGLKIMDAWRSKACVSPSRPDLPSGHYVGCHVDHTVVTTDGESVKRVREWPDEIGELIRP